jgi:hypothetical protein
MFAFNIQKINYKIYRRRPRIAEFTNIAEKNLRNFTISSGNSSSAHIWPKVPVSPSQELN